MYGWGPQVITTLKRRCPRRSRVYIGLIAIFIGIMISKIVKSKRKKKKLKEAKEALKEEV